VYVKNQIATAQGEHFNIRCSPMTIDKVSSAIDNILTTGKFNPHDYVED